jgi:hypothetical protein
MTACRERIPAEIALDQIVSDIRFLDHLLRLQAEHLSKKDQKEAVPHIKEVVIRLQQSLDRLYAGEWRRVNESVPTKERESVRDAAKRLGIDVNSKSPDSDDRIALLTGQPTAHFDWDEVNRKLDEARDKDCEQGNHMYGPGTISGGQVIFVCANCKCVDRRPDAPYGDKK